MTFRYHPSTNPTTTPCRHGIPSCEASRRESLAHFPGARPPRRATWHDGVVRGGAPARGGARTHIRTET
jgi:hypothetical protein